MGHMHYLDIILIVAITVAIIAYFINRAVSGAVHTDVPLAKDKTDKAAEAGASRLYWIAFSLIMVLALFVRVWKFGEVPGGFNQDGAMAAVDANALASYGTDRFGTFMPAHLYAWGYGQMSSLMSYMMVPFIKVLGINPISARLPILITSMFALWVLYLFIKDIFGRKAAIVVLLFAAINPWHLMQSRWALDANLLPHFFLFSTYFLYKGIKKPIYAYISMVFFGLTMYSYGIAFYLVPFFLVIAAIILLAKKVFTWKQAGAFVAIYLLVAWPIFGVMIVNMFKLDTIYTPFVTIQYFKDSIRGDDLVFFSKEPLKQLITNAKAMIDVVFLQKPDLLWNSIDAFGTLYLFSMPLVFFGVYQVIKHIIKGSEDNKPALWFIMLWFIVSVISGLVVRQVNVNRINIIFYPMIIFAGVGIYYLCGLRVFKIKHIVTAGLLIAYFGYFIAFNTAYYTYYNERLSEAFYAGFGEAITTVDAAGYNKINVTNYTQSKNSYHVSEIMAQFYLGLDAKYVQGKKKITGKNGAELLPYRERYAYVSFSNNPPNPAQKNVAYVVNNRELGLFDTKYFTIQRFKYYSAVTPKR